MLKDLEVGDPSSKPILLDTVNGVLVFTAYTAANGLEPWRTDGTADGTYMLNDIYPSYGSSEPYYTTATVNGNLFFTARGTNNNHQLWKTDGSTAGTIKLRDIPAGSFMHVGNVVFFAGYEPATGTELWKSDGTPEGTVLVADIVPGPVGSAPRNLIEFNGVTFFTATNPAGGFAVWKSDGNAGGTTLVKPIHGSQFVQAAGTLFFAGSNAESGAELWRTDGTDEGTRLVADLWPGSTGSDPQPIGEIDGKLLFLARTPHLGRELWACDGGVPVLVKDINATTGGSYPARVFGDGTNIYFSTSPIDLWKTDGTESNTFLLKRLNDKSDGLFYQDLLICEGHMLGSRLLFSANTPTNGTELWRSDGTVDGTVLVKDINPGIGSSEPRAFTLLGNRLYYAATNIDGTELWSTDGTDAGTLMVKDLLPGPGGSSPDNLTVLDSKLLFTGNLQTTPYRVTAVCASDGTAAGTVPLVQFIDQTIGPVARVGSRVFFTVNHGSTSVLWKTEGSVHTTTPVKFLGTSSYGPMHIEMAPIEELLLFTKSMAYNRVELWRSDGTPDGTVIVRAAPFTAIGNLVSTGPVVFFYADDGLNGAELWRSDGTPERTYLVKDINPGPGRSGLADDWFKIRAVNRFIFFWASDPERGLELWMSDGTLGGTIPVTDVERPFEFLGTPGGAFEAVGNTLFFNNEDLYHGKELWKLDVPIRPRLHLYGLAAGVFHLGIEANPNQTCVLEATSPDAGWSPLSTNTIPGNGLLRLTNSISDQESFFRVRTIIAK